MNSSTSATPQSFWKQSGWLLLLFIAAVLIRVCYVWTLDNDYLMWPDEKVYDKISWNLAQTGRFEATAYNSAPVLPAYLALVYRTVGHSYRVARIGQALLGGVLVLAISGIAIMVFDRRTAILAGIGTAFYPQLIYLAGVFYAEHMFAVLLSVMVFALVRWQVCQKSSWLIVGGMLMGLAALCRSIGLGLFPFVMGYVWWGAAPEARARRVLVLTVMAVATVLPWTVRNAFVFRHFVPVSTGAGLHLWRGNNALSLGNADDRHLGPLNSYWEERAEKFLGAADRMVLTARMQEFMARMSTLDEVEGDALYAAEGQRWMAAHPASFVKLSARRLVTLYSAFSKTSNQNEAGSSRNRWIAALSYYPALALGLAGLVLAWEKSRPIWAVPAVIAALTVAYLPMTACTRFRLPLDAFWILLASYAVMTVWARWVIVARGRVV